MMKRLGYKQIYHHHDESCPRDSSYAMKYGSCKSSIMTVGVGHAGWGHGRGG